jgi:hypothetical protein
MRTKYWRALVVLVLICIGFITTRKLWFRALGESLVCKESVAKSDAILIENLDDDYLLFERAASLIKEGLTRRVFVAVQEGHVRNLPNTVSLGFAKIMAQVAQIPEPEIIPIRISEPITLNTALQVQKRFTAHNILSVIIVTSGFRSRRTSIIWEEVMRKAGIKAFYCPVFGSRTPQNWHLTWHGRQQVLLEAMKLAYYRLIVMPQFKKNATREEGAFLMKRMPINILSGTRVIAA